MYVLPKSLKNGKQSLSSSQKHYKDQLIVENKQETSDERFLTLTQDVYSLTYFGCYKNESKSMELILKNDDAEISFRNEDEERVIKLLRYKRNSENFTKNMHLFLVQALLLFVLVINPTQNHPLINTQEDHHHIKEKSSSPYILIVSQIICSIVLHLTNYLNV